MRLVERVDPDDGLRREDPYRIAAFGLDPAEADRDFVVAEFEPAENEAPPRFAKAGRAAGAFLDQRIGAVGQFSPMDPEIVMEEFSELLGKLWAAGCLILGIDAREIEHMCRPVEPACIDGGEEALDRLH